ncbi:MAG: hypothetical protein KatS3mg131_2642 [Candidatus Tectimicrobiota bacterium]|nr:MAG: hypothetical protein KatS3mg131_2642 [Candidatus Tectomicrobia bacterium]
MMICFVRNRLAILTLVISSLSAIPLGATAQQGSPPPFQMVVLSKYDFSDTLALLKAAIESENLMLIKEIDPQQMLRLVGVNPNGMRQLLFFHPRFMKRIMEANPHATLEPPLKVVVMEAPQGKAIVKYVKPSAIFSRYEGLAALAQELDTLLARIVANVQQ